VDTILGLLFTILILYIIQIKNINLNDVIIISLILMFLILAKESGILFALVALALIVIYELLKKENTKKKIFLIFFILLILTFGAKFSWDFYVNQNNLNIASDVSNINITNIKKFITGKDEKYRYNFIHIYLSYLLSGENFTIFNINVSVIAMLIITIIIMAFLYIKKKDKKILYLMLSIIVINVLFLFSLFITYEFVFAQWEAEVLSAQIRYVQTLNIINVCTILYVLFEKCEHKKILAFVILLIIIFSGTNRGLLQLIKNKEYINSSISKREKYMGIEQYRYLFNENDKIYLVTDYLNELDNSQRELDLLILRYQIAPFKIYMFNKAVVSQEKIINKLSCQYTYIYFYNYNEEIYNMYKFLLKDGEDIEENSLFKLYQENGNFVMEKVK
jgi:hypothetical protein